LTREVIPRKSEDVMHNLYGYEWDELIAKEERLYKKFRRKKIMKEKCDELMHGPAKVESSPRQRHPARMHHLTRILIDSSQVKSTLDFIRNV
jgi:hypothetical protein